MQIRGTKKRRIQLIFPRRFQRKVRRQPTRRSRDRVARLADPLFPVRDFGPCGRCPFRRSPQTAHKRVAPLAPFTATLFVGVLFCRPSLLVSSIGNILFGRDSLPLFGFPPVVTAPIRRTPHTRSVPSEPRPVGWRQPIQKKGTRPLCQSNNPRVPSRQWQPPENVHVVLIALYACSRSGRRAPSRLPPTVLPAVKVFFSPLADPKSRTTCSGGSRLLFKVDGFPRANHRLNGQPLSGRREPVALCTLHRHRFNGLASLMSDGRAVSAEQLAAGITLHQSNNTSVENTQEIQHIKNE